MKSINSLIKDGKKIIIVFNKIDVWNECEINDITKNIYKKIPSNSTIPVIIHSNKNKFMTNQQINLDDYINKVIKKSGEKLLIFNTFQLAHKLSTKIKETRLIRRKKEAQSIIGKFATIKASSVALNPLAFLDIAGGFVIDTALIKELSEIYGLKLKSTSAKNIFKTISVNNLFLGAAQIGINSSLNFIRKMSLISAPFTNGMSLLPYGPIAIAQACLAINSTKLIGQLAAKEIIKKSNLNEMDPTKIIKQVASLEPDVLNSPEIFSYNQTKINDLSLFIP